MIKKQYVQRDPLFKDAEQLMKQANMTVVDFANWLECPIPTVRYWLKGLYAPRISAQGHIEERLNELRDAIAAAKKNRETVLPLERALLTEDREKEVRNAYRAYKKSLRLRRVA